MKIYQDPNYVTLFRYEKPKESYDEAREGIVSKKELVGQWFSDDISYIKGMMLKKNPDGRIVVVRVLKSQLSDFDASQKEETKNMDIDPRNYIIPGEIQSQTRIEIPVDLETRGRKNYLWEDREKIDEFLSQNLSQDALLKRIQKSGFKNTD